ncbi:8131_t:CDS:2 [Entrophospora sp. SA101]|nr:8131_t:CDS:2 [Entrophospora sp. SA101]
MSTTQENYINILTVRRKLCDGLDRSGMYRFGKLQNVDTTSCTKLWFAGDPKKYRGGETFMDANRTKLAELGCRAKQYLVKKDQELVHCCKEFAHMENNLMNARDPAPVPREVSAGAWLDLPEKLRVSSE